MYEFYVSVPNDENGNYTENKVHNCALALAFATMGFQTRMIDTETKKSYLLSVHPIQTDNT